MSSRRAMTKSPVALAKTALATAKNALPQYSAVRSRHDFTQPQLFAILVLRQFFQTDYRGVVQLLHDFSDLQRVLELKKIPHFTTLQKAEKRLEKKKTFHDLVHAVFAQARVCGLSDEAAEISVDATGLSSRHISRYFLKRSGRMKRFRRFVKLTAACDNATHLIAGAVVSMGPNNDAPGFEPAVRQAARCLTVKSVLADAAYDAEAHHRLCREELGIGRTAIPVNTRGRPDREPKTRYRRAMAKRFPAKRYGQRWQSESVFSRLKRHFGEALSARTDASRAREVLLRVLVHDLMILRRAA